MWYLCVFHHRLLDFRKPEVESLAELFGGNGNELHGSGGESLEWRIPKDNHLDSPFHYVNLSSEDVARNIANRSMLVKGIYEVWGEGSCHKELEEAISNYPDERKRPYLTSESTFKITVDSFGKVIGFQERNDRIKELSYIPFKGRVNLKSPDYKFWFFETDDYGVNKLMSYMLQGRVNLKSPDHKFWFFETDDYGVNNGLPPVVQKRIFFGREVGGADRKLITTYQLKSRRYLGPTAMDAEMAFLMANQALVTPGKLIYDPFVGTGSILVAVAHFGAMTMGADIDIRVLQDGHKPDCNVWSNFKQYGLPDPIALLRADNNVPPWRQGLKEIFDAVVCDPPYGVRVGGRKSGGLKLLKVAVGPYTVPDDKRTDHIPSTAPYNLVECVHNLLDLAARMLVIGGRLVYFYPVLGEDYNVTNHYPEHPCFRLIASSEQILSLHYSRVLLTMVKTAQYSEEIEESARLKHLEFKLNHLKWLEEGNLHASVFSPVDSQFNTHDNGSKELKPKYRGNKGIALPFVEGFNCTFPIKEASIDDLQLAFKQSKLTSRQLVEFYINQIHKLNPELRGVIEVNPDAIYLANKADQERNAKVPGSSIGLHGIPILLKDNIATKDKLNTTAGSYALLDSVVPRDAGVVAKLRKAGAIILGKASLSEWAHFRSSGAPSGFCARSGQGKNPYVLSANPSGSSSGSGISVAANMATVSLGTETDGSILSPSDANSVVGIKPTVGLTSRAGVIPISPRQDTVGPMCRTVADAVYVLDAIAGFDKNDPATGPTSKYIPHGGYGQFLKPHSLKGKRLGIVRNPFFQFSNDSNGLLQNRTFEHHLQTLKQEGAILVDHVEITNIDTILTGGRDERYALLAEFKPALNKYLKELVASPVRSLAEIIAFNKKHSKLEKLKKYGQDLFEAAESADTNGIDTAYQGILLNLTKLSEDGLEKLMRGEKLDAVVTPGSAISSVLAIGGHPGISVPAGYDTKGIPFGICFSGLRGTEPKLIEIAYGFEQATKIRRPPTFKP